MHPDDPTMPSDDRNGPAWIPAAAPRGESNLARLIDELGFADYAQLHAWSARDREGFWAEVAARLDLRWRRKPDEILDRASGIETPRWFPGARFNIAESCFLGNFDAVAIIHRPEGGKLERWTWRELELRAHRVARGLAAAGFGPGDPIAVDMPMTAWSVAIYLGIVLAGGVVVSIADSFAPDEIATRLRLAQARGIFTEDVIRRGGKTLPLYEKVVAANAPRAIVRPAGDESTVELREGDLSWRAFLDAEPGDTEPDTEPGLHSHTCTQVCECKPGSVSPGSAPSIGDAETTINLLFSSGTTGDPKAIPWTQTTPLKCASDGRWHQDIRAGDVVAWPTNLGWMMGPWLIFAALLNRATIALWVGNPGARDFCSFVEEAEVTILGLVPSLVKAWRGSDALDGVDWSRLRAISSTGEASDPDDYRWLMERVGAPVIEYCGGTELGGGYLTGTLLQPAVPGTFTTAALGLDLVLLDDEGLESDEGEVFLLPPSIGFSTQLLNRDHHEVYYAGTPAGPDGQLLRRHGDRMERLPNGSYRAHGRTDDTMNLGGIKVSSAEIERVLNRVPGVVETAAVGAPPPGGGPERLVVFAVLAAGSEVAEDQLATTMRTALRDQLNPLFRLAELRLVDTLPRTASHKVMRRVLRDTLRG